MVIEKMMPLATKVQQQSSLARNDESSEDEDNLFDNWYKHGINYNDKTFETNASDINLNEEL